jgi:hypothetical protein
MVGDPARCIEIGQRYAASGCDMLFCLVNPYKIPHRAVMRSIELLGEKVIPQLVGKRFAHPTHSSFASAASRTAEQRGARQTPGHTAGRAAR